jgi:nicotinamidase-related amidase
MSKRIIADRCCGVIIDVQTFFLGQVDKRRRAALKAGIAHFARLLGHLRIPTIVTLERPLERKGGLPEEIAGNLGERSSTFEKDFFDLTREKTIRRALARLRRRQAIVTGCETDVCVLQSCLGLLDLGYDVFVVEELVFSSTRNVGSALERMEAAGVTFLTYKTLYYELLESVDGGRHRSWPDDLPDSLSG